MQPHQSLVMQNISTVEMVSLRMVWIIMGNLITKLVMMGIRSIPMVVVIPARLILEEIMFVETEL
jgi:hypothetical protein